MQFAANMATGVIDRIWQRQNDQHNLNDQADKARELTRFNRQEQEKLFENTSYPKQVELMKRAGLSVGKMYGQGGGGGSTALAASAGVNAEKDKQNTVSAALMQSASLEQQKANIELTKAQTENVEADTVKKTGADTDLTVAQTGNVKADTAIKETNKTLMDIEVALQQNEDYNAARWSEQLAKAEEASARAEKAIIEANIADETKDTEIETIRQNLANLKIQGVLAEANIKKTNAEVKKLMADISNKTKELELEGKRVDVAEKQMIINGVLGAAGIATGAVQAGKIAEAMKKVEETTTTSYSDKDGYKETTTRRRRK